ncbi:MAG: phage protease [Pseudomonadota bacterium]
MLRSEIDLASGKAPTEIRLFRAGENETDRGSFLFDEMSAAMVMGSFASDGKPRLHGDWNHGMLSDDADRDRAAACCSFVPEVRNGELFASDIQWTEDGKSDVETRRYNYFSPAFTWELSEDGAFRIRSLINFALVNLAGLKNIDLLLAAKAAVTQQQESNVEYEKLYTEARAKISELEGELKTSRSASSDVVALSAAVGLAPTVPNSERVAAVSGLVTLRGEVFKITGQSTPEGAVAALHAMKTQAAKTVSLEAERENEKVVALTAELDGVLDGAVKELKLEPAKKDALRASLVKLAGGKVTADVVEAAKTNVSMLSARVAGVGAGPAAVASGAGGALNDEQIRMAALCGITPDKVLKAKHEIEQRAVARGR